MNRFYADANLNKALTQGLRQRGIDIVTAQEEQTDTLLDHDLLRHATRQGRVLVTHDRDFLTIGAD